MYLCFVKSLKWKKIPKRTLAKFHTTKIASVYVTWLRQQKYKIASVYVTWLRQQKYKIASVYVTWLRQQKYKMASVYVTWLRIVLYYLQIRIFYILSK